MVNSTEIVVHSKTNFVKVVENQTLFRKPLLVCANHRHVTYHEIEATFDISGTSMLSILHEHLTVKKICSPWIPHNLSIAQKDQSIRVTKMLRQLVQTLAKVYTILMGNILKNNKAIFND